MDFQASLMRIIGWLPGKELPGPADIAPQIEAQQSAMTTQFNGLHDKLFPHFFRQIQVEEFTLAPIRALPAEASLVYVTPTIGQLEFNYFNYFYMQNQMPLPLLANGLSLFFWRKWGDCKRLARLYREAAAAGQMGSPVRSGLWAQAIRDGVPTLVRLKTSRLHDDLYWDNPQEDPLAAVITAAQTGTRPVYCIPQDFIWDKHPERQPSALTLFLIGDRDKRGPLRRFFHFLFYYKRRAIVKFGTPLHVQDWLAAQNSATPLPQLIQGLRAELLTQMRIERTAITGPGIKPRAWLIDQVIHSESVQRCIYDIAQDQAQPVTKVLDLARRYTDEIAADPHHSMIEITARLMRWVLGTLYDGITVDDAGLQRVKRAMGAGPVVLVPNHRSHMDYLLISTILYSRNVAVPFIAGGINMNFWPVGPIFRHCGAYFLRRSFGGNPLYKAVFQSYVTELVRQNYCQEFFIEGTRSRTGKMAHPKLGMLAILVESWRQGAAPDITFVPVSVTYDQVMEVGSYTSELKGAGKTRERARDIMRLGRFFKRRWGHVYLRFGEPLSMGLGAAELWTPQTLRVGEASRQSRDLTSNPEPVQLTAEQKPQLVQHLAKSILYAINREAVVTPTAVVAMVLLSSPKACTREVLLRKAHLLLDYLSWKGAPCSPGLDSMPEVRIQETLEQLVAQRSVVVHSQFPPTVYTVPAGSRNSMDYTKNTGLHFFVSLSTLARLILRHGRPGHSAAFDEIHADYNRMKELFAFEFNFSTRKSIADHLHRLLGYLKGAQIIREPLRDRFQVDPAHTDALHFLAGLLDTYVVAYRILFRFVRTVAVADAPERQWIKAVLHYARQLKDRGEIRQEEAISKSIFQNGLLLFHDLDVCETLASGNIHWKGRNSSFDKLDQLITSIST